MSFERSWNDYADGFGDVYGNFWLGLDEIHELTAAQPMSLQIDVVPFHLPSVSIPYLQFQVGDAASDYLLNITTATPGYNTLYTSFNYHSGMKFTTHDRDNDLGYSNCATQSKAGWWFRHCYLINLNGVYGGISEITGSNMRMNYLSNNLYEPIRSVTMKIKAIN